MTRFELATSTSRILVKSYQAICDSKNLDFPLFFNLSLCVFFTFYILFRIFVSQLLVNVSHAFP
nr:MAG TPA: hypothetical protein [Bacteriophage sp.]